MNFSSVKNVRNGEVCSNESIPEHPYERFCEIIKLLCKNGSRPSSYNVLIESGQKKIFGCFVNESNGTIGLLKTPLTALELASVTPHIPALHLFERVIAEDHGLLFIDHPWLKPVRFPPKATSHKNNPKVSIGKMSYFSVEGDQIHEVAVGPVHAGIIEPGHFRFQCSGEEVLHLEISLGYQHRGILPRIASKKPTHILRYLEVTAGDTSIGHAMAGAMALESLMHVKTPARAQVLRGVALELERCANHIGDLGALSGDAGYMPTSSFCGRIRGDFLNLTALLCGNRFGRSLIVVGGTRFDGDELRVQTFLSKLNAAEKDFLNATELIWSSASVTSRFEQAGVLAHSDCIELGIVGVAARASGCVRDVRGDFPSGIYQYTHIPTSTHNKGDVFSRAFVRWLEVIQSITFIREQLTLLPKGPILDSGVHKLTENSVVVSMVEGWRGEICHVAHTNSTGELSAYSITDPSFHNWLGLALAMRNQQISDFPLCNKSFNLSYCGHDL